MTRTWIKNFYKETDPFNPENVLSGWIDRRAYHTLHITEVNGVQCHQEIACTPKLKYPFDLNYVWKFPENIKEMVSFEKYDGTNILQYVYKNENFKSFISYKTRGTLFVNTDTEFYPLLLRCFQMYPEVEQLVYYNGCNVSYELYGYLNPHLIIYNEPIELRILFGVKQNGLLLSVDELITTDRCPPKAEQLTGIQNPEYWDEDDYLKYDDYYAFLQQQYNIERKEFEANLSKDKNDQLRGKEGAVWYIYCESNPDYWTMYKLKPPSIEEIHWGWAKATKISKLSITATIWNATEDIYPVTFESVEDLLLEEYSDYDIKRFYDFIKHKIFEINCEKDLEREIIQDFKENDLDGKDKSTVLRWFAGDYGSNRTTKIYHVLRKFGLLD